MRRQAQQSAVAPRYSQDERLSLVLLLAPFMIIAASLASQQALRSMAPPAERPASVASANPRPAPPAEVLPPTAAMTPVTADPVVIEPAPFPPATAEATAKARVAVKRAPLPPLSTILKPEPAPTDVVVAAPPPPAITVPEARQRVAVKRAPLPPLRPLLKPEDTASPAATTQMAALDPMRLPESARTSPGASPDREPEKKPAPIVVVPPMADAPAKEDPNVCHAKPDLMTRAKALKDAAPADAIAARHFGRALAAAARAQLDDLVIYNPRYAKLSFPNGDVSPLYGVCTDVVVRAYRALDIDLQQLVYQTKSGRGDVNIDHRRVEVLKRFLDKHGDVLPITDLAEDYQPGDIVTYYRPQNRTTTTHIAIVTDIMAPSGRPLILHNRGWGPQLEDALFVDKITGHYRFSGLPAVVASAPAATTTRPETAATPLPARRVLVAGKAAGVRAKPTAKP
ncbi:MAG: DUF1287 domain-containing protein [Hyphomicrobiaceae bacterium]